MPDSPDSYEIAPDAMVHVLQHARPLILPQDLASWAGLDVTMIYRLIQDGELEAHDFTRTVKVDGVKQRRAWGPKRLVRRSVIKWLLRSANHHPADEGQYLEIIRVLMRDLSDAGVKRTVLFADRELKSRSTARGFTKRDGQLELEARPA